MQEVEPAEKIAFAVAKSRILRAAVGCHYDIAWEIMQKGGPGQVEMALEWIRACTRYLQSKGAMRVDVISVLNAVLNGLRGNPQLRRLVTRFITAEISEDANSMLEYGVGGKYDFGRERQEEAIVSLGLPALTAGTAHMLFGALAIARGILTRGYLPV